VAVPVLSAFIIETNSCLLVLRRTSQRTTPEWTSELNLRTKTHQNEKKLHVQKSATTSNPENLNTLNKIHKQNRIHDASSSQMKQDKLPKDDKPPLQLHKEQLYLWDQSIVEARIQYTPID
jgi:hypothetical protein